jgi:hypothetical protein
LGSEPKGEKSTRGSCPIKPCKHSSGAVRSKSSCGAGSSNVLAASPNGRTDFSKVFFHSSPGIVVPRTFLVLELPRLSLGKLRVNAVVNQPLGSPPCA